MRIIGTVLGSLLAWGVFSISSLPGAFWPYWLTPFHLLIGAGGKMVIGPLNVVFVGLSFRDFTENKIDNDVMITFPFVSQPG